MGDMRDNWDEQQEQMWQQQFEHQQEEEWHEHQRRLINQIHEITEKAIVQPVNARLLKEKQNVFNRK